MSDVYNLSYYTNQVFCVGLCISSSIRRPGAPGDSPGAQGDVAAIQVLGAYDGVPDAQCHGIRHAGISKIVCCFHRLCLPCNLILKIDMTHIMGFSKAPWVFHFNIAPSSENKPLYKLTHGAHYLLNWF